MLAADLVRRIDEEGSFANIVVPAALERSGLAARDRALVTELAYGATRRRRSCDWLIDRYTRAEPDPVVRSFLRVGAYQLAFTGIPAYAAVGATVAAAPMKVRSFVNAVLRRLVQEDRPEWPDDGVRLSYPDWIIDRLTEDLGREQAVAALERMNESPPVTGRADGYVQDLASQWVAQTVRALPGERVLDLCAAPGGKATAIASTGATVFALDRRHHRAKLVASNTADLGLDDRLHVIVADGRRLPFAAPTNRAGGSEARFDRVLVDAPCSGLGALRRRPDARWRVEPDDVTELAHLQLELLTAAMRTLEPGGLLVYSVCTLTRAETIDIDDALSRQHPDWRAPGDPPVHVPPVHVPVLPEQGRSGESPWEPLGRGHLLVPQAADTDGMYVLLLRAPG